MRRATTPTIQIDSDVNLKDFEWFRLTFAQRNGPRVVKTEKDWPFFTQKRLTTYKKQKFILWKDVRMRA